MSVGINVTGIHVGWDIKAPVRIPEPTNLLNLAWNILIGSTSLAPLYIYPSRNHYPFALLLFIYIDTHLKRVSLPSYIPHFAPP